MALRIPLATRTWDVTPMTAPPDTPDLKPQDTQGTLLRATLDLLRSTPSNLPLFLLLVVGIHHPMPLEARTPSRTRGTPDTLDRWLKDMENLPTWLPLRTSLEAATPQTRTALDSLLGPLPPWRPSRDRLTLPDHRLRRVTLPVITHPRPRPRTALRLWLLIPCTDARPQQVAPPTRPFLAKDHSMSNPLPLAPPPPLRIPKLRCQAVDRTLAVKGTLTGVITNPTATALPAANTLPFHGLL